MILTYFPVQALRRRAIDLVSGETGRTFSEIWEALNSLPSSGGEGSLWCALSSHTQGAGRH